MNRVRVIERSLRCYAAGWWSLVPVIGLLPAAVAVYLYFSVRQESSGQWNPAAVYLGWGVFLGAVCGAGWLLLVGMAVIRQFY